MEINILDTKYVLENGVNYDDLELEMFTDRVLETKSGKAYTGLVYESYDEGVVTSYGFYKDGLIDGYEVHFHDNGKIKKIRNTKNGSSNGIYKIWNEENKLIKEGEYRVGVHIRYRKYDINGELIEEKKEPTERELELIKAIENRK